MSSSQANSMMRSPSAESLGSGGGSKTCVCAPSTHAGSFRCRLHRKSAPFNHQSPPVEELPPSSQAAGAPASRTVEAQ